MGLRLSDWQSRLAAFITAAGKIPFEWGAHDCALFACNGIEAITGTDPAAHFRGRYSDKLGAYRALQEFAGGGLAATAEKICAEMGFKENMPNFHQRGDVALCDNGGEDALGLIDLTGRHVIIASEGGLARKPLSCVKKTWRVG